ncbi:MAG: MobP3 family relaxase [Oscillospiraceae bacterium]
MPRLVTKFKYLKPGAGGRSVGGYARYIATREGVERIDDTHRHAPATKRQQVLIEKILRDFPDTKQSHEYRDFRQERTAGNASEFISMAMEENLDAVVNTKTYADYIATRPRAERFGSHGLFTDDGVEVQLSEVSKELNAYRGNVYTAILSLKREDAARLGFDHGSRWRDFLRGQTPTLSENLKIPMNHLRWYAAFHNEGHHPHVHLIAYSTVPGEGHLSTKGVEKMRSEFARDIFSQELLFTYQQQTEYRDRLSCTTGKKVYGYLKSDVKAIVDQIVAELAGDENIRELYDLWYEQRESVLCTYTDHFPERVPLEQNKEFKSIRNAVIQESLKINDRIRQAAEPEPQQDVMETEFPSVEEPDWWSDHDHPRFIQKETGGEADTYENCAAENATVHRASDGRDWWSYPYKQARRFLYGTEKEKPDFQKAMPLLHMEAREGNGYACYDLGRMYLLGLGCDADEEEAQTWFRSALGAFQKAEQMAEKKGYLRYRIGKCHALGHGTEQNYEESARWFRQAVEENNPFAVYSLGGQYLRGQGVEQSNTEAYRLYTMAAVRGNAYAQYQLGRMYQDGIGTEANLEESKRWYAKAYAGFLTMEATMADDKLCYRLGSMNMTGTGTEVDLEKSRYYFEKAVELGSVDALYGLGKLYLKPEFSEYDPEKAVEYLELAAAKDNAFARYQLGKLFCQGKLVQKDIARGLPLLEELAEAGVTSAAYIAGKVYLKEEGWQDVQKAIRCFHMAAEDGNSYAEYQLGKIYYFGNGIRADREKGLEYLARSAAHGNMYAENLLRVIQQQHIRGAASLIAQLGRMFQEKEQQDRVQHQQPDRKQRRQIDEKKQALGIRD